jgi:predicted nucleotidyltransferase
MTRHNDLPLGDLATRLRSTFEKYRVQRAIVFGSLARGEGSRRSDVDLLIVQQTEKPFLARYDGILSEITLAVSGRDVDLLIYTPEELAQLRHRRWMARVLQEGKTIYESECEPTSG